jgi:hypothetical protein
LAFGESRSIKSISYRIKNLDTSTRGEIKMNDVVWSVIIMLGIGLAGTLWIIYYILKMANDELNVPIQNQKDHQDN